MSHAAAHFVYSGARILHDAELVSRGVVPCKTIEGVGQVKRKVDFAIQYVVAAVPLIMAMCDSRCR